MYETLKNKVDTSHPVHVPEIKLYCVNTSKFSYPYKVTDFNTMFGYPTWSSIALSRFILDNKNVLSGKRVSELGCGSGVCSIAAAMSGAETQSIDRDVSALYFTAENHALNGLSSNLVWGSFEDVQTEYVIMSSLFYEKTNAPGIKKLLDTHKVLIGCFNTHPPYLHGLTKFEVNCGDDFYVLHNFNLTTG